MTSKPRRSRKKIFVLDTNVYLHDPMSAFKFEEHDVFLPFIALEELDRHKEGTSDVNRNARQASRLIEAILESPVPKSKANYYPLEGFPGLACSASSGFLVLQDEPIPLLEGQYDSGDNRFLAALPYLRAKSQYGKVVLVSKDLNLRIKARMQGFEAQDYLNDHAVEDSDLLYTGYRYLSSDILAEADDTLESRQQGLQTIYSLDVPKDFNPVYNEMLILPNGTTLRTMGLERGRLTLGTVCDRKNSRNAVWGVTARNAGQSFALNLLMDPDIDLVTLLGQAGTGKTLLALAAALEQIFEQKRYNDVIFTRATVPMGEDIGFLPGSEEDKMMPWLGALEDNLDVLLADGDEKTEWGKGTTRSLIEEKVKVKSMSFMRGRTFNQRLLIIDEAQNLTAKQVKALTTRAGEGTKVICLGNLSQIDTPYLSEQSSGLAHLVERFKGWPHFGHIILESGERSRLANWANEHL